MARLQFASSRDVDRSSRRPRVLARDDIASKKNPLAGLAPFISTLTF
jgi:hypothetical protein